jgi:hypothetical protein
MATAGMAGIQVHVSTRMRRMKLIRRIAPGALNPRLQEQRINCFVVARGEFSALGTIRQVRSFRRIRVET